MYRNLKFKKYCNSCKVQLELEICLCCNYFINICSKCVNDIILQYFLDDDNNAIVFKETKVLCFIKLLTNSNFILFCNKCINLGLYYKDNDSKIDMLINLYLKRHRSF
jgi:hypothetical protein